MAEISSLTLKIQTEGMGQAQRGMEGLTNTAGMLEGMVMKAAAAFGVYSLAMKSVSFAVDLAKETALLSARYETLGISMVAVGKNAGETATMMNWYQKALQETGISAIEARNNLARMAAAQLDLSQSAKLARVAQDAAVLGNINSSEAFERLVQGIVSGQPRILHTMGIFADFGQAEKRWADAHGKTMETLSQAEKVQIRFNATLEEGAKRAGVYEAAMGTAGKQLKSMERYVEDLKVQMGEVFQPALIALVDDWSKNLKTSSDNIVKNKDNINDLGKAMAEVVRQGDGFLDTIAKMGRGQTGEGANLLTRVVQSTSGAMAFVRDYLSLTNGGAIGAIQDARGGKGALADWAKGTFGEKQRTYADWTKVGASDSEGGEGGDPYGVIALAQKKAAMDAAKLAAEAYAKVITPLNQAMEAEHQQLEFGSRAAYAYALTLKGVHEADKEALLVKWDYNNALKDQAEKEAWIQKLDHDIRSGDKQRASNAFSGRQNDLQAEGDAWIAMLDAAYPWLNEAQQLAHVQELLDVALAKGAISLEGYRKRTQDVSISMLRLKAESGDTWAIIGYTVTQNAGRATDAIVSWMDNLEGLGHSWRSLGDTVRNVIKDMLIQMQKAIIQQQLMSPLMNWAGTAISAWAGGGSGGLSTSGTAPSGWSGMTSYAVGTDYVPYDMVAQIHQGERIIPASQNKSGGGQVNNVNINVKVDSNGQVSSEASGAAAAELARRIAEGVVNKWYMEQSRSGGVLAGAH